MISQPIFKRDSLGKIRSWQYELDGSRYRTIAGVHEGTLVVSGWTECTAKSQPTDEDQAKFEAEASRLHKLAREYHPTIDTIDTPNFFKPMLATVYEGWGYEGVYCQPKLDGIRCIATSKGLFSRQGKQIFGVPHIEEVLAPVFGSDPTLILDGELYNHELKDSFGQIASIVRKQDPSPEQLELSARLIQYHVYDIPSASQSFGARANRLIYNHAIWENPAIRRVSTSFVTGVEQLDRLYADYLKAGYEGQMVRLDAPYEQNLSKALLKRKEFQDREFTLLRLEEGSGNWAGYAKRAVLKLDDGREFGAGIRGNKAFTRELLTNSGGYIGKPATVRFFALTPDGVPRFPVAVDFARVD